MTKNSKIFCIFLSIFCIENLRASDQEDSVIKNDVRAVFGMPWYYLRLYTFLERRAPSNDEEMSKIINNDFLPPIKFCAYAILYNPKSKISDMQQLLEIHSLTLQANTRAERCEKRKLDPVEIPDLDRYKQEAAEKYRAVINDCFKCAWRTLWNDGNLPQTFKIAMAYKKQNSDEASIWLEQVRSISLSQIEKLARRSVILVGTADVDDEQRHAKKLISAFHLEDDSDSDLSKELQRKYEDIFRCTVSLDDDTMPILSVQRRLVSRLFPQDDTVTSPE